MDKFDRMEFCDQFSSKVDEDDQFLSKLWMSDEAHFHLSGFVNKQNFRHWLPENPQQLHEETFTQSEGNSVVCNLFTKRSSSSSSSSVFCLRVGPSLKTQAPRLQFRPKAGVPLQTQEPRLQFY